MTKHMLEGALSALEAASQEENAHQATYMDIDNTGLEGARSDKDACDEASLIKAIRNLNMRITALALAVMNVDVEREIPGYETNGMVSWSSFKAARRPLLKALQHIRKGTVAGPMGGRTGSTTGSFEVDDCDTKQQVHLANIPTKDGAQAAVVRWQYNSEVVEMNDGAPATFGEWLLAPTCKTHGRLDFCPLDEELAAVCKPVAGIPHERAGEMIAMWRVAQITIVPMGYSDELDALFDAVHAAQLTVKMNRRREEDLATQADDCMEWGIETDDLFPQLDARKAKRSE